MSGNIHALIALVSVGALGAAMGCGARDASGRASDYTTHQVEVEYDVTGTTRCADLTMTTPTGTEQAADKAVPLDFGGERRGARYTFSLGDFVRISAQSCSARNLSITCVILVDGREIARNTSTGAYAVASCEGTA